VWLKRFAVLVAVILAPVLSSCTSADTPGKDYYHPPISGDTWATESATKLGWNEKKLDELIAYVRDNNATAFIILHRGKIVVEEYWKDWDIQTKSPIHSVQKSVLSLLIGIAQEREYLKIDDKVSEHLGSGWSKAPAEKEDLITIKHLLTMTSGLTGGSFPSGNDLKYEYDVGTWWQYNTSAYVQLLRALEEATGVGFGRVNEFAEKVLYSRIGMHDSHWDMHRMTASARDMARFGLLILGDGWWNNENIIEDKDYLKDSLTPLDLYPQYGYLWWLNTNRVLVRIAPEDLITTFGFGDKSIRIVPSLDLVVVRHGEGASSESFSVGLWERLMEVLPDWDTS